jgi:hypothetical protein
VDQTTCDLQILAQLRRDRLLAISKIVREDKPDWQIVRAVKKELAKGSPLLTPYPIEGPEVESGE